MKTILSKVAGHSVVHHVVGLVARRLLLVAAVTLGHLEQAERFAAPLELALTVALLVAVELVAHKASHAFRARRGRNLALKGV